MLLDRQRPRHTQFYASLFNQDSLLNYLPQNALLVLDEPRSIAQTIAELDAEAEQMRSEKLAKGELPRNFSRPYFTWGELEPVIQDTGRSRCRGEVPPILVIPHQTVFAIHHDFKQWPNHFLIEVEQLFRNRWSKQLRTSCRDQSQLVTHPDPDR